VDPTSNISRIMTALLTVWVVSATVAVWADDPAPQHSLPKEAKPLPDLSGEKRLGIASFYADSFAGRTMADGTPMNPDGSNAASRTLPLGTKATVTNLETGKSATVIIKDRGPYVKGRIVDLSPATARKIGITQRKGISKVVVAPITVPQPDGTLKKGVAAREKPIREAALVASAHDKEVRENSRNDGQRGHDE
jgi:rare lipoprotein A